MLATVDFEAYPRQNMLPWLGAMEYWAECAARHRIPCSFFISLEDTVALRRDKPDSYAELKFHLKKLNDSGARFYPHNHYLFDTETGGQPSRTGLPDRRPPGYSKRYSLFSDVVYTFGRNLPSWMKELRTCFEGIIRDAGCELPNPLAFRAGGWDYGSSRDDLELYADSLLSAGFSVDSSACGGSFGTPAWRVGADFGDNVFFLKGGLLEVAPCWSLNCHAPEFFRSAARSLFRPDIKKMLLSRGLGCFVPVIHFDHLFHTEKDGALTNFALADPSSVKKRIANLFLALRLVRTLLRLECVTFEELANLMKNPIIRPPEK